MASCIPRCKGAICYSVHATMLSSCDSSLLRLGNTVSAQQSFELSLVRRSLASRLRLLRSINDTEHRA